MAGQGRSVGTPNVCQQRCKDTPGCTYFNNFPNGGCHITTGAGGERSGGSNTTAMSGTSTCLIAGSDAGAGAGSGTFSRCTTSGKWYLPLNMAGQGRSVGTPNVCQQRCKDTPGCTYFNNFPNGGCHITTGAGGERSGGSNTTA